MREKTIRHISVGVLFTWLFLFFALLTLARTYAAETRIFNRTNLFSATKKQELGRQIATERGRMKLDLVIVTTSQAGGKGARAYADDFYNQGDYGYGTKRSDVLYLIGVDNRRIHVSTASGGIQLLSDSEIKKPLDLSTPGIKSGNHAESTSRVLPGIQDSYRRTQRKGWACDAESGVWIKKEHLSPLAALGSLTASLVTAFGAVTGVRRNYKMQDGGTRRASAVTGIIAASSTAFDFSELSDRLLDRGRVERRIRHSGGGSGGGHSSGPHGDSSTHTSSGSSSHDSGSRSF